MSKLFYCAAILVLFYLASCSSQNEQIIYEPRYEILSEKIYEGEKTSALLQRFPDTAAIIVNKKGIQERDVNMSMLLYLPDSTKDIRKPNPFSPILKYYFAIDTPSYVTMSLKIAENDSMGYKILQDSLSVGNYLLSFQNCNLESGIYHLEFKNRDTFVHRKFLLIK